MRSASRSDIIEKDVLADFCWHNSMSRPCDLLAFQIG